MPRLHDKLIGASLAIQLLLLVFSFSPTIAGLIDQVVVAYLKDVIGPVSAGFGGAIAGAFAAFHFQSSSEERKELKADARTLYMVKLNYVQKLNDLCSIKMHMIFPHKDHRIRFLLVGELPESPGVRDAVDQKIFDLLISVGAKKVIDDVLLADKRYEALFENFKKRNMAILDYRNIVNTSHLGRGFGIGLSEVCDVVEPGRIIGLFVNSEELFKFMDDTIETMVSALEGVGKALDKKYQLKGFAAMKIGNVEGEPLDRLPSSYFNKDSLVEFIKTREWPDDE